MARSKSSTLNDPKQALDLIRSLIQTELNEKIQFIMQEYVDTLFQPAIQNIRKNLNENLITGCAIQKWTFSSKNRYIYSDGHYSQYGQ